MANYCKTFGSRLLTVRKTRGISQQQLGEMCGLHASQISLFENDKRQPMLDSIYKLATALECSTDYLLGLNSDMDGIVSIDSYNELLSEKEALLSENETLYKIIRGAGATPVRE